MLSDTVITQPPPASIVTPKEFGAFKEWSEQADFVDLLPLSLNLDGKPFNISKARPMFAPLFRKKPIAKRQIFLCGRQLGKALALDTPIPTPTGWTTMGDIQVGDEILDDKGRPTKVLFVTTPMTGRKCYKVTFDDDSEIVADAEHLWKVCRAGDRHLPRIVTTEEWIALQPKKKKSARFWIQGAEPQQLPQIKLPIPPLLLGYWLGDGEASDGSIYFGQKDYGESLSYLRDVWGPWKKEGVDENEVVCRCAIGLLPKLREIGVLGNKHIPQDYLRASIEQRLELLRGLMDSNGCVRKNGGCENTQKNKRLAENLRELLSSLGIKSRLRSKVVNGTTYWTVGFATTLPVFKLRRKAERHARETSGNPKNKRHYAKSIESIDSVPVKCIEVASPGHLFLAGRGMIPTHNTASAAGYCTMNTTWRQGFRVLYVAPLALYVARFHHIYMSKMLRHWKMPWEIQDKHCVSNVAEKTFVTGSHFHGVSCWNSPGNALGIPADVMVADECDLGSSLIYDGEKLHILVDMRPGDNIVGFDEHNKQKLDTVKAVVHKGRRHVWRIHLANGRSLDCTGNGRIKTSGGWIHLAKLLPQQEADRCPRSRAAKASYRDPGPATARVPSGGRLNERTLDKTPKVLHHSWTGPGGILPAEGIDTGKLCKQEAKDCREQGVGQKELCLQHSDNPHIRSDLSDMLYRRFRSEDSQKESHPVVVKPTDNGGGRLVVHGRRLTEQEDSPFSHPVIFSGRAGFDEEVAQVPRCAGSSGRHLSIKEDSGTDESLSASHSGGVQDLPGEDASIHDSGDGLQMGLRRKSTGVGVPLVSEPVHGKSEECPGQTVLRKQEVQGGSAQGGHSGLRQRPQGREERQGKTKLPFGPGGLQEAGEAEKGQADEGPRQAGSGQRAQEETPADGSDVFFLPEPLYSFRPDVEGVSVLCLPDMQEGSRPLEDEAIQEFSEVVRISYLGEDDVYDIETERYHTFFANGIGVHNCQDLNIDFLPQILETLGTSTYGHELYFGTARGTENTIQKVFDQSSQSEFAVKCPGCNYWNIPSKEQDALAMIQPQGVSCAKCGKVLDVEKGQWVHAYPDRVHDFVGWHVPQTIVKARIFPHDNYLEKIYNKLHGVRRYSLAKFYNEVMGISVEMGSSPITPQQIRDASTLPHGPDTPFKMGDYAGFGAGVDWGGSEQTSFTVGTLIGWHRKGEFHVLNAIRPTGVPENERHLPIAHFFAENFRQQSGRLESIFADGEFVGRVQNKNLEQVGGVPVGSVHYGTIKRLYTAQPGNHFVVDRTTLIYIVFSLIKSRLIRFPSYEGFEIFTNDLKAVYIEETDTSRGQIQRYQRYSTQADDFLHTLGYALLSCSITMGIDLAEMVGLDPGGSITKDYIDTIGCEMPIIPYR